ncbi:MAG: leucyl aminopeptidase [Planctomycetota bacterium]|nr:MAG: leucyl aminopeptidase [Planctomycetota bacterium]
MRLTVAKPQASSQATPLLVVLLPKGRLADLPGGALGERAVKVAPQAGFKGEARQSFLLHSESRGGPKALLLLGLGPAKEVGTAVLRRVGTMAGNLGAKQGAAKLVITTGGGLSMDDDGLAALGEGLTISSYRYRLKQAEHKPPAECAVVASGRGAAALLKRAQAVGDGVNLARELGDLPGNVCTPSYLRDVAAKIAKSGRMGFKAHGKAALKRMKMGGILAVNQGSATEPFLLEMDYNPRGAKRTVCVVGKGLTFDSGGISIKPSGGMEEMKYDMCGAGTVLGLMKAVALTRPKGVRIIAVVGTTDNMSGADAYKPGDVVTTGSGKTIEVINTDAEGRVVLADALHLAAGHKPDAIIDLATLTGAIVVALGHEAAGLFTRDEALGKRLLAAGDSSGERIWPMPTYGEFSEAIKSKWADVRNSSGRNAGSSTAAAFLFEFSGGIPHAHIDIAGAAWEMKARDGMPAGARGYGVRLLHDALSSWR